MHVSSERIFASLERSSWMVCIPQCTHLTSYNSSWQVSKKENKICERCGGKRMDHINCFGSCSNKYKFKFEMATNYWDSWCHLHEHVLLKLKIIIGKYWEILNVADRQREREYHSERGKDMLLEYMIDDRKHSNWQGPGKSITFKYTILFRGATCSSIIPVSLTRSVFVW